MTVHELAEARHMAPAEYERERAQIRSTYGDSSAEAAGLRDQALAKLFHRSGWTQEELAKAEGKSQRWVAYRLSFGRFLGFSTSGAISEIPPRNLTERRFRDYWERTDKSGNDRQRFVEVSRLLSESAITAPRRQGLGREIIEKFGDGKWHNEETIARHVKQPPESLRSLLTDFRKTHNNYGVALCEKRQAGKHFQYRIMPKGRSIDLDVLMTELEPILEELEAQGQKNTVTISPPTVALLAHRLRKLIEKLAK